MIPEAINKILSSMGNCHESRVPAAPIAEFLEGKCQEDEEFAALVIQEHKTLSKCFSFVYDQAYNHLNHQNGWISDHDVYMMAVDYFALDDEELERQKLEEEEKRQQERQQREEERQQKAAQEKEAKKNAAELAAGMDQLSLFE